MATTSGSYFIGLLTRGPLMSAARRQVRRAAALTRLAPAPKEVCILKTPPFARPAGPINVGLGPAAPVRLRRPYNKENYSPRALQRVDFVLITDFARARQWLLLKPLAARACY